MTAIDAIDQKILRELAANARISNVQLAERVGLSPSACLRRVAEMERTGLIRGYGVRTDPDRTGRGFAVYVMVGLSHHTKAAQEGFERAMAIAPEVAECHNIAGAFEYLLRVECAGLADYKRFHTEVLGTRSHVNAITSHIVMGSPKDRRA